MLTILKSTNSDILNRLSEQDFNMLANGNELFCSFLNQIYENFRGFCFQFEPELLTIEIYGDAEIAEELINIGTFEKTVLENDII